MTVAIILRQKGTDVATISPEADIKSAADWLHAKNIGALLVIDSLIPPTDMFAHPEVDLKVALGATVLLVIAGALAGLFPARTAARVNPIVALRDE